MKTTFKGLCVLLMLLMLAACGGEKTEPVSTGAFPEPVYEWGNVTGKTITIWGGGGDLGRPYLAGAFERYEELTGNTVNTVVISQTELDEKIPYAFNTAGAEKPDILLCYGGTNFDNLDAMNNFYDFTDALWVEDLSDIAINQTIFDGKVMGLPCGEASVSGTLYNKEIFKKYDLEIPKTQDEFLQVCASLLEEGIIPVYLPYDEITMLLYQFPLDSLIQEPAILDGLNDGSLSYAKLAGMEKIVQWYKTMSDAGYFGEDYLKNNWDGMDGAMKSEKYAMMLCWDTWLYSNFTGNPDKFGLMPAFIGTPEEGCFEGPNINMLVVNKNSAQLEATLDLISFMADPYNYNIVFKDLYTAPIFNNQVGSIATPQYTEAERLIEKHFFDSTAWLRIRGFSQIDARYIQEFMQDEITLTECIDKMDAARIARANDGK